MNIALVTNENLWHKYWVCKLDSEFDVKLVLHPQPKSIVTTRKICKKIFAYGAIWGMLKILSLTYNNMSNKSLKNSLEQKSFKYFSDYVNQYARIPKSKVYKVTSINDVDAINLVKENEIDIICNLGGDIFEKEIINSVNIACLNYHSGISPFYNGNKTIFHAVSDFRPNFAGGTLMYMNERIDGGKIISHYLVPIRESDTATDLFMKNIEGSVKLYSIAIAKILNGHIPKGIEQKRSFQYLKNIDWTITDDIKLRYFQNNGRMKNYIRNEIIIDYSDGIGDHTFSKSLCHILNK